jgi:hypothetical protein
LEALIKQMDGVRLRRVDVKSWDSPVAVKNSIRELPTLWLYDGGKLVSSNSKDVAERLQRRAHG